MNDNLLVRNRAKVKRSENSPGLILLNEKHTDIFGRSFNSVI